MADPGRRDVEGGREMAQCGRRVARGLRENLPGDAEGTTGWRGALQAAADSSRNDPEILRLADEVYAAAHSITTVEAVQAYARSTLMTVSGPAAQWFLRGMLSEHLREDDDGAEARP